MFPSSNRLGHLPFTEIMCGFEPPWEHHTSQRTRCAVILLRCTSQVRCLRDVPVCIILANSIVNICKNLFLKMVKRCKISDKTICQCAIFEKASVRFRYNPNGLWVSVGSAYLFMVCQFIGSEHKLVTLERRVRFPYRPPI